MPPFVIRLTKYCDEIFTHKFEVDYFGPKSRFASRKVLHLIIAIIASVYSSIWPNSVFVKFDDLNFWNNVFYVFNFAFHYALHVLNFSNIFNLKTIFKIEVIVFVFSTFAFYNICSTIDFLEDHFNFSIWLQGAIFPITLLWIHMISVMDAYNISNFPYADYARSIRHQRRVLQFSTGPFSNFS